LRAPIGGLDDKVRILRDRVRVGRGSGAALLRGDDVSTIQALRDRGYSETIIDRFFRPLFGGIQLDADLATSRRMFDVILRSLGNGKSAVPANGMQAIPDQLAVRLRPGSIRLRTRVRAVAPGRVTLDDGSAIDAACIVVATEGPVAHELLRTRPVDSRSVGCVYFTASEPPPGGRYVVLDGTGRGPVLNVAVMSNVAPSYAPSGQHLIACALPAVIDGDLEAMARRQLARWWGQAAVAQWRHLRTYRIAHGQPDQQPPFAPKRRVSVGDGLFVCGDHRDTGSIQGALYSGRRCALEVLAQLS
jgi:phytoene dehydrogenase-like protein